MTRELAQSAGATLVTKNELFRQADVLTIHVVLSKRTRGLVGVAEIQAMKPTAWLINTSRGPIVDEVALIDALRSCAIARCRARRLRRRAAAAGTPLPVPGQRPGDSPHRVRVRRDVPDVLRPRRDQDRGVDDERG